MLNRRILRIKAFKELFAIEMLPDKSLAKARQELDVANESTRDLYLFMMAFIPALTATALARQEQAKLKVNKTKEDLSPNLKFIENSLSQILLDDPDFGKLLKKKSLSWDQYDIILKKTYSSILQKQYFNDYMNSQERSLLEDCRLFIRIFEEELFGREDLESMLEDMSIWWNDDLAYSLTWCCRSLEDISVTRRWSLPPLFLSDKDKSKDDDRAFVHKLLETAYVNYDKFTQAVSKAVPNWDSDRIVGTDLALIVTALAEIVAFPSIPVNVSINEYVEISKYYGTAKSSTFVNGILDTLSKQVEFKKQ